MLLAIGDSSLLHPYNSGGVAARVTTRWTAGPE